MEKITLNQSSLSGKREQSNYRRFWILALLAGVEKAGASPMDIKKLNLLAYFANAVSRCYDIEPVNPILLKEKQGPLYPEVMFDLNRLVGVTMVRVGDIVLKKEAKLAIANYSITAKGLSYLDSAVEISNELRRIAHALDKTAIAFCRSYQEITAESVHKLDANLSDPKFAEGDIVDFGQWDNYSATSEAVKYVEQQVKITAFQNVSNAVNLYARYLASKKGDK
jgi:hypothetical protein